MKANHPILRALGVVKEYGTLVRTQVLKSVDLQIEQGEFVALIGPSGSGKSTLLNTIGLLERPTAGLVSLAGTETTTLSDEGLTQLRARTLGFIFQFHHLLPAFNALENVMLPGWAGVGYPTHEMRKQAEELLRSVGLGDRIHYKTNQLSGGQQQRVAIARALARSPLLVLADEPTGNLDTQSANEVFELMRTFNETKGTSFLVVTHDTRIAERCDRIVEIIDGQIHSDVKRTAVGKAGEPITR